MKKEEAIKRLTDMHKLGGLIGLEVEDRQALSMGIDALEVEPCEDAISRKAVLDIIRFEDKWLTDTKSNNANTDIAFSGIKSKVTELPPIQPKAKVGHWIDKFGGEYRCSYCREIISIDTEIEFPNGITYKYCPNCGAKMQEVKK